MQELKNTVFLYFQILPNTILKIFKLTWCSYLLFYGRKNIISKYDQGNRREIYIQTNIGYFFSLLSTTIPDTNCHLFFWRQYLKVERWNIFLIDTAKQKEMPWSNLN